ncbi:hypothetical protein ACFT8P_33545 [Streptomyces sp. NPDC057101]|uniref:hypothetical protein n=1 Tax=Streptomyces sp. NPDC057101 TaxID=3346020 RepID=UPI00364181C4
MEEPDGAEGHVGKVGVLLKDGTVPEPIYIDIGSGGGPAVTDWFCYDGSFGRSRAERMRAVCACGWASGAEAADGGRPGPAVGSAHGRLGGWSEDRGDRRARRS